MTSQKPDGSLEVSKEVIEKLNSTSPDSLVASVATYTKNENLKKINPSIWSTAISMQYLKNTAGQHENNWTDKYAKAREYIRSQLGGDDNLVKELLETSDKYVVDNVTRKVVKEQEEKTLEVKKLQFDENIKKESYSYLAKGFNINVVRSLCSTQRNDGSFPLDNSIKKQLKVTSTDKSITNIKSYIGNQRLRTCKDSVFETALTIYTLTYVLVEYKGESGAACKRANTWLIQQLDGDKEAEKELFEACEQYLIEVSTEHLGVVVVEGVGERIEQATLDVSEETRQTVTEYLQSRCIIEDVQVINKSQNRDGSFTLHSSIIEHLQISSVEESVKGLTRYVGIKSLKECDKSIWQTAFVITYLKIVLVEYESEWRNACEKASNWVSKKVSSDNELKQLYSACDQYLIEKAIDSYNDQSSDVAVTVVNVDDETKTVVFNGLKSNAKVEDARSLCKSQAKNGSFTLPETISKQLKISSTEEAVGTLKTYVGSLRLRRLDKNLWITAFIITYFEKVLVEYKSEWLTAHERARSYVSQQVHNSEFEKELYSACDQYLIQRGCEFINSQNVATKD